MSTVKVSRLKGFRKDALQEVRGVITLLSMGFSRQGYWSGLPFPSPEDLPDPGIDPGSPALQADALPSEPPGKPQANPQRRHHLGLTFELALIMQRRVKGVPVGGTEESQGPWPGTVTQPKRE